MKLVDRARQALDRPHDLHPRRADHRPPLRGRAPAARRAAAARRHRQHGARDRAQPRRHQVGRLDHRPRARGRRRRRQDRRRGHARSRSRRPRARCTGQFLAPVARAMSTRRRRGRPHAGWWQDEFTDGADPEYEEQILPLVARAPRRRATRVLDIGMRRGPGRAARRRGTARRVVVGVDPSRRAARGRGAARRAARATCGATADALPVRRRRRSTRWSRASCSSTSPTSTRALAEVARVLAPGRTLPVPPEPPAAAGARTAAGSTTTSSASSTGGSARTSSRTSRWRSSRPGVVLPFVHRPLSRYVNPMAELRPARRAHGRARTAARVPRPGARVPGRRRRSRGSWCSGRVKVVR